MSFYPIDVAGLRTSAPLGGAVGTLRTLAENTDGFAIIGTNDLTGAVRRIESDLSAYYLLGYHSTNPLANGRFRRIEVKVKDPNAQISARRGYFAMTPELAAAAAAPRADTGPSAVDESLGRLATIRPDAALFIAGAARQGGVGIVIELAADAVKREGWAQGTTVQVTATGADDHSATASATLAAGERNVRVELSTADAGGGPWRIVARAVGRDGTIEERLEIPAGTAQLAGRRLPTARCRRPGRHCARSRTRV